VLTRSRNNETWIFFCSVLELWNCLNWIWNFEAYPQNCLIWYKYIRFCIVIHFSLEREISRGVGLVRCACVIELNIIFNMLGKLIIILGDIPIARRQISMCNVFAIVVLYLFIYLFSSMVWVVFLPWVSDQAASIGLNFRAPLPYQLDSHYHLFDFYHSKMK